jgi:hypothetical protein
MRLRDLDPRWLKQGDLVVGLTFLCPHCKKDRLTCFSAPTPFREQVNLMHAAMHSVPEDEDDWPVAWVPSNCRAKWSLSNTTDFDTLTVSPSIDASASGNWHGFIKNGEIK